MQDGWGKLPLPPHHRGKTRAAVFATAGQTMHAGFGPAGDWVR
jgi:hypothetical protein